MAENSDSAKQIRASVTKMGPVFALRWNALIDQTISALTTDQAQQDRYSALDQRAAALVETEKAQAEAELSASKDLSGQLASEVSKYSSGQGGHDVLSVLSDVSLLQKGPYKSAISLNNQYIKMGYNKDLMIKQGESRARDIETLKSLKV